jgi:hypothetical protein
MLGIPHCLDNRFIDGGKVVKKKKIRRRIDQAVAQDFQYKLSFESWDSVFCTNDINKMYNYFLNSFLKIFYSSFPLKELTNEIATTRYFKMATCSELLDCHSKLISHKQAHRCL